MTATGKLPSFREPPVVEVSLSLQFEPLTRLRTPHLGLFWARLRDRFPSAEERSPLPPAIEDLGRGARRGDQLRVEMFQVPPVPRAWFLNREGSELVQLQQDRFVVNWRKISPAHAYPRYKHVRELFDREFSAFRQFVSDEDLGSIAVTQCEVTYVNHIFPGDEKGVWSRPGQLGEVVTVWTPEYSDSFLSEPEDVRFNIRYLMTDQSAQPRGRLQIGIEPKYGADDELFLAMVLNARVRPSSTEPDPALDALDQARNWIVRGFTSITTETMHQAWGRYDNT